MTETFSIVDMIRAQLAESWKSKPSFESRTCEALARKYGVAPRNGERIPATALRDLTVATGSAGGFLVNLNNAEVLGALAGESIALKAGATVVAAPPGQIAVPSVNGLATTTWLATETATITESQPLFGQVAGSPRLLSCFLEISRQLLIQSNAEQVVRAELRRAAAAELDRAVFNGSGASGQPTGILQTAGIGAFTGTSLNQAALRNAQADVLTANANFAPASLAYVAPPAVAELLSTRQRFTGSDRALWEGALQAGTVEGVQAFASSTMPASTAIFGQFASIHAVEFSGGLVIETDPWTKFQSSIIGVRLLLPVDILVTRAAAFSVATGVT